MANKLASPKVQNFPSVFPPKPIIAVFRYQLKMLQTREMVFNIYVADPIKFTPLRAVRHKVTDKPSETKVRVQVPFRDEGEFVVGVQAQKGDELSNTIWSTPFMWGFTLPDPFDFELILSE